MSEPIAVRADDKFAAFASEFRLTDDAAAEVIVAEVAGGVCLRGADADGLQVNLPADFLPREFVTAIRLVGENVRLRRALAAPSTDWQALAHTDALTGLPNRRAWDERLAALTAEELARASLALVDLDRFKDVNDRAGHLAGDAALQDAARALRQAVRARDLLARIGGDEFGVLLLNCAAADAGAAAERIRRAVSGTGKLTASAGVASARGTAAELLAAADVALLAAKDAGRDRTATAE